MNERTTNDTNVVEDILAKFPRSADGVLLLPGTPVYCVTAEIKPSSLFKEHHVTSAVVRAMTIAVVTLTMEVYALSVERCLTQCSDAARLLPASSRIADLSCVFFDREKAIAHMTSRFPHHNPKAKESADAPASNA